MMTVSVAFAIYRLPYGKHVTLVQQMEGEPMELVSCTDLNGKSGFVVAPFEVRQDQPILLIRPDRVETFPVEDIPSLSLHVTTTSTGIVGGHRMHYSIDSVRLYWRAVLMKRCRNPFLP